MTETSGHGRRTGLGRWGGLLAGLTVTCALAGCSSSSSATGTRTGSGAVVPVVAGENFWGDITRQIGGVHVKVTSIITDPNADPHSYETDPKDAAAMSAAGFVVLNGAGYDDFASKLLDASPKASRTVLSLDKVVGLAGANPNPHLWYNPPFVKAAADAIEAQLAKSDPADAATFASNEATFLAAYQPYVDTLAAIRSRYAGARIAYTERVPGYLVAAAGLVLGTPASFAQSIEDGNDPSPADTAAMDGAMNHKTVKVLLYNAQVTSPATDKVKMLATASGVPIVGVSETIPRGEQDFQSWQIDQARAVLTALGG
jgi:zinc/manganese transport system substrate-binding protein